MPTANIRTPAGRSRLEPRREPYFVKIAKGQHIGFRRLETGGTWVAKATTGKTRQYRPLGAELEIPEYKDALRAALDWFHDLADEERPDDARTVADAIDDYVKDLRTRKGADAAGRARQTADRHILRTTKAAAAASGDGIGKVEIAKLTTRRLKAWRDGLIEKSDDPEAIRRSKDTANRVLSILKAALNLAFRDGVARSDAAWRRVAPFRDVTRARDVFLSVAQCDALCAACGPDFRPLVRSALLTGARYGELTRRRVSDIDLKQGILRIPDGKTGPRNVVLSDAGIAHFRALAKDKLPSALLHYREETRTDETTGEPRTELVEWGKSEQHRRIKRAVNDANEAIAKPADRLPVETCFYSLRHTHASLALLAGVNIQILAENIGTSVRMLEKHYGKFLHADRRAMFNALPAFADAQGG